MNATTNFVVIACAGAAYGLTGVASADTQGYITADEARAIAADLLAEGEERSSLLHNHEGNSTVSVGGAVQFRYLINFGDDGVDDDDEFNESFGPGGNAFGRSEDVEQGFDFATAKIWVEGEVGDGFSYFVNGDFADGDNSEFTLEDAWISYDLGNNWSLMAGQFKTPFSREELVEDWYQLGIERSITNEVFGGNRTQGIAATYQDDNWRVVTAITDGFNADNTSFRDEQALAFDGGGSDFSITARAEFKGAGTWDQFKDFTSMPGSEFAWLIGGALHWEIGDPDDQPPGTPNAIEEEAEGFGWTIDASLEGDGWNAFAAYTGLDRNDEINSSTVHGFLVQGGWFIPDSDWELFGRYDVIFDDGAEIGGNDDVGDGTFNALTFGTNYYIHGHAAKITVDVLWALNETSESASLMEAAGFTDGVQQSVGGFNNLGYVGDDDENEVALRGQFQLLF